eukprot:6868631-Pyramimonas_sp.AAC.1
MTSWPSWTTESVVHLGGQLMDLLVDVVDRLGQGLENVLQGSAGRSPWPGRAASAVSPPGRISARERCAGPAWSDARPAALSVDVPRRLG